jgi:hypothetical protein
MREPSLYDLVMDGGLRDWFASLEADRAAAAAERDRKTIVTIVGAAATFGAVFLYSGQWALGAVVGLAALFLIDSWARRAERDLALDIKMEANSQIARTMGMTYVPQAAPNGDFSFAMNYALIPSRYDEIYFRDGWEIPAPNQSAPLQIIELEMQEWQQSGKSRRLVTTFQGIVMGYQFARPFSATTTVMRDMSIFNAFGAMGAKWGSNLERVRLVDPRFEEAFEVYSSDQVEARYLVHPVFCERLIEMERAFHGKNLRLAFTMGRVIVAIEADDQFETGGADAKGDEERVAQTIAQIEALLTLSRTLNERAREIG